MNKNIRTDMDLDNFLQDILKEAVNNQRVPDDIRDRVRQKIRLGREPNRRISVRGIAAYAAVALFLFFLASIFFPNVGSALNIRLLNRMESFLQQTIFNISEVYHQDSTIKTNKMDPPPINEEAEVQKKLEDAKDKLPFKPLIPGWLPKGITLKDVEVIGEGDIVKIVLKYSDKQLMISEMGLCDNTSLGVSFDKEDSVIENIMVRGKEGAIVKLKNDTILLKWADQGIFYRIQGDITPDEIKKIANNLVN